MGVFSKLFSLIIANTYDEEDVTKKLKDVYNDFIKKSLS